MPCGERQLLRIDLLQDWSINTPLGTLSLQAIVPSISTGLLYLFARSSPLEGMEIPWVEALPAAATELMLYAPLVVLIKCPESFRALSWNAWKEITTSSCLQDFGMPSSMATSLNGGGEEEMDVRSLKSESLDIGSGHEDEESDTGCNEDAMTEEESGGDSEASIL